MRSLWLIAAICLVLVGLYYNKVGSFVSDLLASKPTLRVHVQKKISSDPQWDQYCIVFPKNGWWDTGFYTVPMKEDDTENIRLIFSGAQPIKNSQKTIDYFFNRDALESHWSGGVESNELAQVFQVKLGEQIIIVAPDNKIEPLSSPFGRLNLKVTKKTTNKPREFYSAEPQKIFVKCDSNSVYELVGIYFEIINRNHTSTPIPTTAPILTPTPLPPTPTPVGRGRTQVWSNEERTIWTIMVYRDDGLIDTGIRVPQCGGERMLDIFTKEGGAAFYIEIGDFNKWTNYSDYRGVFLDEKVANYLVQETIKIKMHPQSKSEVTIFELQFTGNGSHSSRCRL